MIRRKLLFVRVARAAALPGTGGIVGAGSLEPPPGPISATLKTLDEVEARKPIHQSDLPSTISADGAHYLAGNLYANQNSAGTITVVAKHVSLALNGFASRHSRPPQPAVRICARPVRAAM